MNWSEPFHGVQHLGKPSDGYWVSIADYGTVAELALWFPGCKFSPMKETHDTAESARAAGQSWLKSQRKIAA